MRQLDALGVPPSTIARWQHWWTTGFVGTPFWSLGRAAFVPPVEIAQVPASLLERFATTQPAEPLSCLLRWLSPLTSGSAVSILREGR
ncbi:hypothetical protein [Trinickia symbiotica]|uniref:hypothetical protein n=1 Tax=Trinickia symbiotica TaxID=863227 RepID=UPI0021593912|nr:hypothetical protein [Trinickia symbiotica]